MIKQLTPTHLILIVFVVYYVVMDQIKYSKQSTQETEYIQQIKEQAILNDSINSLNNKVHSYEIKLLKKHLSVDGFSNAEIDSVWSSIF